MAARNPIGIHYVYEMARAKRFYTGAFDVPPSFESRGWTTLDFGTIELALHSLDPPDQEAEANETCCPEPGAGSG